MPRVQCPESVESLQNFPKVLKDIGEAPIDNRGNEVAGDSGNQSAWIYEAGDLSPSPRPAFKCRVSGIITSQFVAIAPRVVVTLVSARLRSTRPSNPVQSNFHFACVNKYKQVRAGREVGSR
ncbi:hypothetical protein J6590_095763 [Homalodisca vitripennis]|nr:hypothetical protein J6590_095763 [Homalodisca vitripennis]